jgi:hypothetical protein
MTLALAVAAKSTNAAMVSKIDQNFCGLPITLTGPLLTNNFRYIRSRLTALAQCLVTT